MTQSRRMTNDGIINRSSGVDAVSIQLSDYLQILFLILIGYLIWGEIPRTQSFIGGSLIVASGLYIWARERKLAARFNQD